MPRPPHITSKSWPQPVPELAALESHQNRGASSPVAGLMPMMEVPVKVSRGSHSRRSGLPLRHKARVFALHVAAVGALARPGRAGLQTGSLRPHSARWAAACRLTCAPTARFTLH